MLVDGEWDPNGTLEHDDGGNFVRQTTSFRNRVSLDPDETHPVDAGRYHLYVSYACPWAHRTLIGRALLDLESHISVDVVDPIRHDDGWEFDASVPDSTPDTVCGSSYLREVYLEADPAYTGRVTVPILWDRDAHTIVNNESIDILEQLDTVFGEHFDAPITLFPTDRYAEIKQTIDDNYTSINNGVYRAGFAASQAAYDAAIDELFEALEHWDGILADQRYLLGEVFTAADICLFTTLLRFDPVYHVHFKCSRKKIEEYPHLHAYVSDLAQHPAIAKTINLEHIRKHYYISHNSLNPRGFIAAMPANHLVDTHDRDELPGRFARRDP